MRLPIILHVTSQYVLKHPNIFRLRKRIFSMHLLSHKNMYIDVDSKPGPDRFGVAYMAENENTSNDEPPEHGFGRSLNTF